MGDQWRLAFSPFSTPVFLFGHVETPYVATITTTNSALQTSMIPIPLVELAIGNDASAAFVKNSVYDSVCEPCAHGANRFIIYSSDRP